MKRKKQIKINKSNKERKRPDLINDCIWLLNQAHSCYSITYAMDCIWLLNPNHVPVCVRIGTYEKGRIVFQNILI